MKLASVTRIRNEEDIVEAFVRHHAALVDHLVFLANGSNDRTLAILRALQAEGLPITLESNNAPVFDQARQNTFLFHVAAELGADWVLYLDSDEFIDPRGLGKASLRDVFASLPERAPCVQVPMVNYHPTVDDSQGERVVPLRQIHRDPQPLGVFKVWVRAQLASLDVTVGAGNHEVFLQGTVLPCFRLDAPVLAHYYKRSGWRAIAKAVVGRLKVIASGREAAMHSSHYTELFENFRDHPEWLIGDPVFMQTANTPLYSSSVRDPITYLGGELKYTEECDEFLLAMQSIIAYAEALARHHGELWDAQKPTAGH